jgi:hypothetical protein
VPGPAPTSAALTTGDQGAADMSTSRIQEPMNVDTVVNSESDMRKILDLLYYLCRSARLATFRDNFISVAVDDT